MMLPGDTLRLAMAALRAHKLRTTLTLLGLVIGVTSLILVMTLIQGANTYVETKIANLGADVFQVSKQPLVSTSWEELSRSKKHRNITEEDWRATEAACALCGSVGAQSTTLARVYAGGAHLADVTIRGESANMAWIDSTDIIAGRFFSEGEERAAAPVVVIGDTPYERLYKRHNALGKTVRIGGEEFTVVGVAEPIGSVLGQEQDRFVIIPLASFRKIYGTRNSVTLQIQATPPLGPAQDQVKVTLRARHKIPTEARDDFYFTTAQTYLDLWRDISTVFFSVFVLISSVASIVGGIVIMNITLVSVTERRREIGLRRSVGATQRDIASQFLVEVLAQCLAGGLAGVALGFGVALLLRQFTPFPAQVELWVAALGMLLASAIALIFGIYPAWRAAKLDPVVALRSD